MFQPAWLTPPSKGLTLTPKQLERYEQALLDEVQSLSDPVCRHASRHGYDQPCNNTE